MISLNIQIKIIIFSFIIGFILSIVLDFMYKKRKKVIYDFIIILLFSIIYYIGIDKICNSVFHIYSILLIIVGFCTYNILVSLIAKQQKK